MLRMEARTGKRSEDVIEAAISFFGHGGLGLQLNHRANDHVSFEGGGGFVTIDTVPQGGQVEVTGISQEWELQLRRFVGQI
jgi:urease beta subunit